MIYWNIIFFGIKPYLETVLLSATIKEYRRACFTTFLPFCSHLFLFIVLDQTFYCLS